MQTETSQPEGKQITPETRFTEIPASSVDPRFGVSASAWETDDRLFFSHIIEKIEALKRIFTKMLHDSELRTSFGVFRFGA